LDGRTDIWSLGVILYELLTKRRPFYGDSRAELIDEICNSQPIPPRQIRGEISVELQSVCLKCLEKDRSKRFGSAADLLAELRKLASPTKEKVAASHRRLVAGAMLALAVGIGFLGVKEGVLDAGPREVPKEFKAPLNPESETYRLARFYQQSLSPDQLRRL
jgi:serine/threonine-protein kinase